MRHPALIELETKQLIDVDRGRFLYQDSLSDFRVSWSADSRWMAYHRPLETATPAVFLFDTESAELHQVTSGFTPLPSRPSTRTARSSTSSGAGRWCRRSRTCSSA